MKEDILKFARFVCIISGGTLLDICCVQKSSEVSNFSKIETLYLNCQVLICFSHRLHATHFPFKIDKTNIGQANQCADINPWLCTKPRLRVPPLVWMLLQCFSWSLTIGCNNSLGVVTGDWLTHCVTLLLQSILIVDTIFVEIIIFSGKSDSTIGNVCLSVRHQKPSASQNLVYLPLCLYVDL